MNSLPLPPGYINRVRQLADRPPHLIAEVCFGPTDEGGRNGPVPNGFGCVCRLDAGRAEGNDARILFDRDWMALGCSVRASFFFLGGEDAATRYRFADRFLLWDGRFIGEAVVVHPG